MKAVLRDLGSTFAQVGISGLPWSQKTDAGLLRILLINLLQNTVQRAHPPRALRVRINLEPTGDDAGTLTIRDKGTGFSLGQSAGTFGSCPNDMGLLTCHTICQRHGWTIAAESDDLTGACIGIAFPGDPSDAEVATQQGSR